MRRSRYCCTIPNLVADRGLAPRTVVRVSPPTHTVLPSRLTCTRPARPIAVPCAATYDSGRRRAGQPLAEAGVEAAGDRVLDRGGSNARTSTSASEPPSRPGPTTPMSRPSNAEGSGSRSRTARRPPGVRRPSRARCRPTWLSTTSSRVIRSARVIVVEVLVVDRAVAQQRRRLEREPVPARDGDQPGAALLHDGLAARRTTRFEPRVRAAERRVAGERQLAAGGEDPQPVVGLGAGRARAGTSSRTGWSTARTAASARRRGRRRRGRPRPGCRSAGRSRRRRPGGTGEGLPCPQRASTGVPPWLGIRAATTHSAVALSSQRAELELAVRVTEPRARRRRSP